MSRARAEAWTRALREHEQALRGFRDAALQVPVAAWARAARRGGWSPAQVVEHVALAYELSAADLRGEGAMRARVGPAYQRVLRWVLLPHVLFHRSIPVRAQAPREIRPGERPSPRDVLLLRLQRAAAAFEREAERAHQTGARARHPYFGPISALQALRFAAVHTLHHARQLPGPASTPNL